MKTLATTFAIAAFSLFTVQAAAQSSTQFIKVTLTNNSNMPTQAPATMVLMFDANGNDSLSFPDAGNAGTLGQMNNQMFPFTLSADGYELTNFDARPELTAYRTVPFGIVTKLAGDVKVIADITNTDPNAPAPFVWLEQISTGERHNIMDTAKFTVPANVNFQADFILHVGPSPSVVATSETCYGSGDAQLYVQGPNVDNFFYELSQGANVLYSGLIAGMDTIFTGMQAGSYVSVVRINGIPVDSSDVTISSPAQLIADFITDYNYIQQGQTVNFTDNSVGGLTYHWSFGDGDTSNNASSESHMYAITGFYNVVLQITNNNGCTATTSDVVQVDTATTLAPNNPFSNQGGHPSIIPNGPQGNNNQSANNNSANGNHAFASNQRIVVESTDGSVAQVTIRSINGTVVTTTQQTDARAEYAVPATGMYIVTLEYANGETTVNTIFVQ